MWFVLLAVFVHSQAFAINHFKLVVGPIDYNEIISTVFFVVILQGPVQDAARGPKLRVFCMCDSEASARGLCPANHFPNPTTPHTVLFARRRYKKEFERPSCKREHSNVKQTPDNWSHMIARVKREEKFEQIFQKDVHAGYNFATSRTGLRPNQFTWVQQTMPVLGGGSWNYLRADFLHF